MNKVIAVFITLGLVVAAAARADGVRCNLACQQEQQHCSATLGVDSHANCQDGFQLCVQRCSPQKVSRDFLESSRLLGAFLSRTQASGPEQCAQGCSLRARNCIDAGAARAECLRIQQSCTNRCQSS